MLFRSTNAIAYANWIFIHLYTGSFGIRHLTKGNDPDSDGLDLLAFDIATAFMRGISFFGESKSIQRSKYFSWVENILLIKRLKINPEIVGAISRIMKNLFLNGNLESVDDELKKATILLLQDYYLSLPDSLQLALDLSEEVKSAIRLKTTESINIQGINFSATYFWTAISKAIKGENPAINDLQSGAEYRISHCSKKNGERYFEVVRLDNNKSIRLADPVLYIFSDKIEDRKQILLCNKKWFDIDKDDMRHVVDEIASTETLSVRVKKLEFWKKSSASHFYEQLKRQVVSSHSFKFDELLPHLAGLLRHYRFDPACDKCFNDIKHISAQQLLSSEGLDETINRLSKLPTELPHFVVEKFESLSKESRSKLLAKYRTSWASPICKIHLVNLALVASNIELAKGIIEELFAEKAGDEFEQFKGILNWLNQEFENITEFNEWNPSLKLATLWAHASYLQNIF